MANKEPMLNPAEDWKGFVRMLCKMNVSNTSQEIADVINKNSDFQISKMQIAGIRAAIKKGY